MNPEERSKFQRAIEKEVKTNLASGAYEFLSREESEKIRRTKPEKVMKSRYCLDRKASRTRRCREGRARGHPVETPLRTLQS